MSKFCGNCGAQMNDDAKICGACGTPFPVETVAPSTTSPNPIRPPKTPGVPGATTGNNALLWHLGMALSFLLLGILSLTSVFTVSNFVSFSMVRLYDDGDATAIPIIVTILIFVAALLSLVPVFTAPKKRRFIFQLIVSILAFILIVATIIIVNTSEEFFIELSLTFSGWLYIFICLVNIALCILLAKKNK